MDKQLENKLNRMGCSSAIPVIKELELEIADLKEERNLQAVEIDRLNVEISHLQQQRDDIRE